MTETNLLLDVKFELERPETIPDYIIEHYIAKGLKIACSITGFEILPSKLEYHVVSSVVEALNRRGYEGISSNNAVGVSTSFSFQDMEESLKKKLKHSNNAYKLLGRIGA